MVSSRGIGVFFPIMNRPNENGDDIPTLIDAHISRTIPSHSLYQAIA